MSNLEEKCLTSEKLLEAKIINVRKDVVMSPKGECFREVVEHPGGVCILAYTDNQHVILTKQYRYAASQEMIELPAGKLEKNEQPIDCAKRELHEETGYEAKNFEYLGFIYSSPGFCNEKIHLYKATELTFKGTNFDEFELIETMITPIDKAINMVQSGIIVDSKTIFGLFYALKDNINYEKTN